VLPSRNQRAEIFSDILFHFLMLIVLFFDAIKYSLIIKRAFHERDCFDPIFSNFLRIIFSYFVFFCLYSIFDRKRFINQVTVIVLYLVCFSSVACCVVEKILLAILKLNKSIARLGCITADK